MDLAKVIGTATATVKHPALQGWRLIVAQPLDRHGRCEGPPVLAIDHLGSSRGSNVILTTDGAAVRELMKTNNTPVRYAVVAQPNDSE